MSELDWTNKMFTLSKVIQVGAEVEVKILAVDESRRRISLGIKQCVKTKNLPITTRKGSLIKGKIKSITDFGIFLGLEGGIDGLIHLTDVSWLSSTDEVIRQFKKGDELETVVLSIDMKEKEYH